MNANKVVLNNEVLVDLTQDTVTEGNVKQGLTFHKADGSQAVGTSTAIVPSGKLVITENDTYDVTDKASVEVNVAGSGGGDEETLLSILEGTATEISYGNNTKLASYLFYANTNMVSANFPNVKEVGSYTFRSCTRLKTVNLPKVEKMGGGVFEYASVTTADFPKVRTLGGNCFYSCALSTVNMPNLITIGDSTFYQAKFVELNFPNLKKAGTGSFSSNTSATTAYFPLLAAIPQTFLDGCRLVETATFGRPTSIGTYVFRNNYSLKSIVLRSRSVCSLSNVNAFSNAYHYHGTVNATYNPDGLKDGYIYVPSALIEDYKVATNWSTFADQFRVIEDYPELDMRDNYNISILTPPNSYFSNQTNSIACDVGDLVIASLCVDSSFSESKLPSGWNWISKSSTSCSQNYLAWAYKYAESEEESITAYARNIHLFAFKGATGFVDNGYTETESSKTSVTVDKPEGLILWAVICSNTGNGNSWSIEYGEPLFQPNISYKYLMNVLDQSDFETMDITMPKSSSYTGWCMVGSLTIEGIDKFEPWR